MLTTVKRAKVALGIAETDTEQDFSLELALTAAGEAIERECNRVFELKTHRQRLDGPGTPFLRLRNFPIHTVSEVKEGSAVLTESAYEIESENGMLFKRDCWPCGTRNIEVEYTAGYVLPSDTAGAPEATLPRKYELACILFAETLMQTPGVTSERVGDISVSYAATATGTLPAAVAALIQL
ncbi:hypothetical protein BSK66_31560 [Paenibacillus odorifer]|uniref:Phage gp6-like head-tail connector protein n=1 Tax=Paenibacillus odorifer TaxID=189426 RepID=A0A1R0XBB2_9BACL|nr:MULTISPECIES: hypothetical protein [Paenibacillus]ETT61253.1 hypothetical protein C171_12763 [Paenibacillus sp. FSL H8-237]OMD32219.1 hypothetical protein BJP51_16720 [Paenibacillus odorifer]OME46763.1 hypothetical protein BSK66_31560 [Paenibacillus odorifer]